MYTAVCMIAIGILLIITPILALVCEETWPSTVSLVVGEILAVFGWIPYFFPHSALAEWILNFLG